jgi:hypothetical protein
MRNKLATFLTSAFMLFTYGTVHAITATDHLPSETIVLKSPNNSYANWKEIARCVTEKEGMIEYIPSDQQIANWSELICIQYFDKSSMKRKASNSIEDTMELFRESTLASNAGNKVTWRLIEKNKSDAIYEWILHKSFKNIPPEHEVARAFLTDTGLHRIGFTRKNKEMSPEERERCIKSLRDSVSVVSIEEAKSTTQGLSILDRVKDSLNLGKAFENWKEVNTYTFENGYTMVLRVPSDFKGGYVDECLEVTTMPNLYEATIDKLFEVEKVNVQKKSPNPIEFSILKRSPTEIMYSFTHPQDHLQVTGVVRILLSDQGYYSISYKRGLPKELKPEEVQLWKARLEEIQIRN